MRGTVWPRVEWVKIRLDGAAHSPVSGTFPTAVRSCVCNRVIALDTPSRPQSRIPSLGSHPLRQARIILISGEEMCYVLS